MPEQAEDRTSPYGRFGREDSEFDRAVGFFDATYALALTLQSGVRNRNGESRAFVYGCIGLS